MELPVPQYRKYRTDRVRHTPRARSNWRRASCDELGFDPLPYHREGPQPSDEYPVPRIHRCARGPVSSRPASATSRCCAAAPRRPTSSSIPTDAEPSEGLDDGEWVEPRDGDDGEVAAKLEIQESMKEGHLRVPHGWWYPEMRGERRPGRRVHQQRRRALFRRPRVPRPRAGRAALQGLPRPAGEDRPAGRPVPDGAGGLMTTCSDDAHPRTITRQDRTDGR